MKFAILPFFLLCQIGAAQTGADPATLGQTAERLVGAKPGLLRSVGLAEIERSAGHLPQAQTLLAKAAQQYPADKDAAYPPLLLCWRMLPVPEARRTAWEEQVAQLRNRKNPGPWLGVFELYSAHLKQDRAALLAAARTLSEPDAFPAGPAEQAHLELLREAGLSQLGAGLEVLAHRDFTPLHGLRDLDRGLGREADFLKQDGRTNEAAGLLAARDKLRGAYLKAARHLPEKLFALNLADKQSECGELLAAGKRLAYLQNTNELCRVLAQLDANQAWERLVNPLLQSETALVLNPPKLEPLKVPQQAAMQVEAQKKEVQPGGTFYSGQVKVTLGPFRIACEKLSVMAAPDTNSAVLCGREAVRVQGIPGFRDPVKADLFTLQTDGGAFAFAGRVELVTPAGVTNKYTSCTVGRDGAVLQAASLLNDFRNAPAAAQKLALLPKITRIYPDSELPGEVAYFLALSLLRTNLTWHAPHVVPQPHDRLEAILRAKQELSTGSEDIWRWEEAAGAADDNWLLTVDVPETMRQRLQQAEKECRELLQKNDGLRKKGIDPIKDNLLFWRVINPAHPDVQRALRLLEQAQLPKARRWLAELRRNNTVLTADAIGAYARGLDAPVVLDARNADSVVCKLYRVRSPQTLLQVAARIGNDFMFRDYGLNGPQADKQLAAMHNEMSRLRSFHVVHMKLAEPELKEQDLAHKWTAEISALEVANRSGGSSEAEWNDDEDYDDRCEWFRDRIEKSYRRNPGELSSWQCDRILKVPGKVLQEARAYILVLETNGQKAYIPILVEPLSLTLRRCRDGVFALVSDPAGLAPVPSAMLNACSGMTKFDDIGVDAGGAAFLPVRARGDRAIVAWDPKSQRYAIGGFGNLFEGLYLSYDDREHFKNRLWVRDAIVRLKRAEKPLAHVYEDRHLVAAYCDRPSYRPGQKVSFKVIVRSLASTNAADAARPNREFRAADFDLASNLQTPPAGTPATYAVLNPKGRIVAQGNLALNDYGTATNEFSLSEESAVGAYALRIGIGGFDRVVPAVFAVKYYRRPNFELQVSGIPEKISAGQKLEVELSGQYYFGQNLSAGKADLRLVQADRWQPLAQVAGDLNPEGKLKLKLTLPKNLEPGQYFAIASLTDASGRTVSRSLPCAVEDRARTNAPASNLAELPRFIRINAPLAVQTLAESVTACPRGAPVNSNSSLTFRTDSQHKATVRLPLAGWYTLAAGKEKTEIFAYGGQAHPLGANPIPMIKAVARKEAGATPPESEPMWINLTRYPGEDADYFGDHWQWTQPAWWNSRFPGDFEREDEQLMVLLDRRQVQVGDKLKVLAYIPSPEARVLFTIEGRTVVDYCVVQSKAADGDYHVLEIPIKERYLPNFYLRGRILAGITEPELIAKRPKIGRDAERVKSELAPAADDSEDPRWCRVEVLDPKARPGGEKLKVEVKVDRAEYRPGDKVNVALRVTDLLGQPRAAEVSLAAVDESVFFFGEDNLDSLPGVFAAPHPPRRYLDKDWRSFRASRWIPLGLQTNAAALEKLYATLRSMSDRVADRAYAMEQAMANLKTMEVPTSVVERTDQSSVDLKQFGALPVASLELSRLRMDFRETAAWLPQLRSGADGRVNTAFNLPDSLSAYRLTAVGLTKETEIGVGRAQIRAALPLSVQLFLPRFAVEKDRLLAVALIHNRGDRSRSCQARWEIKGARVEAPRGFETKTEDGVAITAGSVKVSAGESERIGIWLAPETPGEIRVVFRAGDGKDADAESRAIQVQPLGRPLEVALNGALEKEKETKLALPDGFVPSELRVTIARKSAAQALDGLQYLVDYPYGCAEQTMSRFLPAVMVKRALQNTAVPLPVEILDKLPKVLEQGLERLYNFQHEDGGWGWYEKDKTDNRMSVYVVYGLARCRSTGTPVNAEVLRKGCDYLIAQLKQGALRAPPAPGGNLGVRDLEASACLALALAGVADPNELAAYVGRRLSQNPGPSPEAACYLALACRALGLNEAAERCWAGARTWQPKETDEMALFLATQVAFGAPMDACYANAYRLLDRRAGHQWDSTRSTAWALEGLAGMLRYVKSPQPATRVKIGFGKEILLDVKKPEELRQPSFEVRLGPDRLKNAGLRAAPPTLSLEADFGEPAVYAVSASGYQRLEQAQPSGKAIRIERSYTTLDGKALPRELKVGDTLAAHLTLILTNSQSYLIVEERRPAGFEFANEALLGALQKDAARIEFRDDRLVVFFAALAAGRHELSYTLRAETPGASHVLPGCAYPMYDAKTRGETGSDLLTIRPF